MKTENIVKGTVTAVSSFFVSILGILAIPVGLMVLSNVIDYITGLMACGYRGEDISSYKSIRGIMKKVCMWLLVAVGAMVDVLLEYASETVGIALPFTFLVACIVAIWIVCNEIISILENIKDMEVELPAFLEKLTRKIKTQVEELGDQKQGNIDSKGREGE